RQERAIRAAVAVADRLGMTSVTPVILKDSNHTSIHLAPFPVVARVVAPSVGQGASAALSAELSVAEHLARAGAPIVAPTIDVPPLLRRTSSFFSRNTTGCGGCLPPRPLRLLPFTVTHILGTC